MHPGTAPHSRWRLWTGILLAVLALFALLYCWLYDPQPPQPVPNARDMYTKASEMLVDELPGQPFGATIPQIVGMSVYGMAPATSGKPATGSSNSWTGRENYATCRAIPGRR